MTLFNYLVDYLLNVGSAVCVATYKAQVMYGRVFAAQEIFGRQERNYEKMTCSGSKLIRCKDGFGPELFRLWFGLCL